MVMMVIAAAARAKTHITIICTVMMLLTVSDA